MREALSARSSLLPQPDAGQDHRPAPTLRVDRNAKLPSAGRSRERLSRVAARLPFAGDYVAGAAGHPADQGQSAVRRAVQLRPLPAGPLFPAPCQVRYEASTFRRVVEEPAAKRREPVRSSLVFRRPTRARALLARDRAGGVLLHSMPPPLEAASLLPSSLRQDCTRLHRHAGVHDGDRAKSDRARHRQPIPQRVQPLQTDRVRRWHDEGTPNPFSRLRRAHFYPSWISRSNHGRLEAEMDMQELGSWRRVPLN